MSLSFTDLIGPGVAARVAGVDGLAHRLPAVAFHDETFLRLEYQRWLARTWLYVGRGSEIPKPGDGMPVPGHPVFMVRNRDGQVRAFQNACRHRGHTILTEPCYGMRMLTCPYHSWSYDLDGALRATPNFGGSRIPKVEGFDPKDYGLASIRCGQWHDWIFINLDGQAEPLEDFVAPIAAHLSHVDFTKLHHYMTLDGGGRAFNWKVAMENNMEPYHVPVVHAKTAAGQPLAHHFMIVDKPVMGCGADIPGSDFTNQPGGNDLSELDMTARYLLRAPNFFITTYAPDKVIDSLILPDHRDPRKCYIQNGFYTTSGAVPEPGEVARWRELEQSVFDEDLGVMARVMRGLDAEVVNDGGVLSPAWEACLAAFYQEMVAAMSDETDAMEGTRS